MRSIGLLAAVSGIAVLASACGDGGGTPPRENTAPVANFNLPTCTINVACNFASTSTDDAAVTEFSWDFNGDGNPDANTANATYTYTTAGTFNVSLTVRDEEGLSHAKTAPINIAPVTPTNTPPTAGFTHTCTATACSFASTSTDVAPGTIATYAWTFGDGGTDNVSNPSHSYTVTAPTDFTVTLTVTDNEGATDVETQTITVTPAPPAAQECTTAGVNVDCVLDITARSTVRITLTGVDCELDGSRVILPPPNGQTIFGSVCLKSGGEVTTLNDATGAPRIFEAGSRVTIRFVQGTTGPGDPAVGAPAGNIDGTFGDWMISIDDGGNPLGTGEPDFTDVVLSVEATAAP